jgi:hypothetical protein
MMFDFIFVLIHFIYQIDILLNPKIDIDIDNYNKKNITF